jgi:hypothetical protein
MRGRITYITTIADTPMQSPLTVADIFALEDVFADTLPIGATQDIYLYWGYSKQDPYYNDQRNVSRSAAGVAEVTNFGSTSAFRFTVPNVNHDRTAQVNEFAIMTSLNEELMNGVVIKWYPDYDSYPAEYYSCIATKRIEPKRMGMNMRFQFDFDLLILPTVQVPSTVPAFVMA